jgi:hypothetical protein
VAEELAAGWLVEGVALVLPAEGGDVGSIPRMPLRRPQLEVVLLATTNSRYGTGFVLFAFDSVLLAFVTIGMWYGGQCASRRCWREVRWSRELRKSDVGGLLAEPADYSLPRGG